jgi:hypothetical protein
MKRLGLKFGQLPHSLLQQLHQLWQENRDGGIAAAAAVIADNLPGGWTDKQVCMQADWFADTVQWFLAVVFCFFSLESYAAAVAGAERTRTAGVRQQQR